MRRRGGQRPADPVSDLEASLDTLLDTPAVRGRDEPAVDAHPPPTPIDQLRMLVTSELMPIVDRLNDRYAGRDIFVTMDPTEFLNGGRSLFILITFKDASLRLDGTVTSDAIAFRETRRFADRAGAVVGGPLIRHTRMTAQVFSDLLHERTIALVKAATAPL